MPSLPCPRYYVHYVCCDTEALHSLLMHLGSGETMEIARLGKTCAYEVIYRSPRLRAVATEEVPDGVELKSQGTKPLTFI